MKNIGVILLKSAQKEVLAALHKSGLVQFDSIKKEIPHQADYFDLKDTTAKIMHLSRVLEIFDTVVPSTASKFSLIREFIAPEKIERKLLGDDMDDLTQKVDSLLHQMNVETLFQKLTKEEEQKYFFKTQCDYLLHLDFIETNFSKIEKSSYIATFFGTIEREHYDQFRENVDKETIYLYAKDLQKSTKKVITLVCLKDDLQKVNEILQKHQFVAFELAKGLDGTAEELALDFKKKIEVCDQEIVKLRQEISDAKVKWEKDVTAYKERLEIMRNRYSVVNDFIKTNTSVAFSCWAKASDVDLVREIIEKATHNNYFFEVRNTKESDTVPTLLDNPKATKPFESIVTMFGPPNYKEFDPTVIITPIFVLFFAFMLGDALYGAMLFGVWIFGVSWGWKIQ